MRRTDLPPDDHALRAITGIIRAVITGVLLFVLLALLLALCMPAHAQILVSIDRADYDRGVQHLECWLVPGPAAAMYAAPVMTVDCHSDLDGIFRSGFEASA